ncbi:MAG: putative Methionine aminopeptidase 2B [Streblomastix strix]|uniref:Methionine aminopeptidase 2 n=1 Tax=Streblomastix strix TaxID=222440 RepID=A0A5J4WVD3_9EUKA|nr:MAG: putative Methionine aminopeptidase 2B [Streblomastix strix]
MGLKLTLVALTVFAILLIILFIFGNKPTFRGTVIEQLYLQYFGWVKGRQSSDDDEDDELDQDKERPLLKEEEPILAVEIKQKEGITLPKLDYPPKLGQAYYQTFPPTLTIQSQFPQQKYPLGKIEKYKDENTKHRSENESKLYKDSLNADIYNDFRQAAEAHRQLRAFTRQSLKPGVKLYDWVVDLEQRGRNILGEMDNSHTRVGHAFPTGLSLNNVAAHYTPNPGDNRILQNNDVIKVDIGIHVNGHIIDSAFSMCFDEQFQPLVEASREGTYTGLRESGVDARLREIGASIEETIRSYEVKVGKKTLKIKPVSECRGHQVGDYLVHVGNTVPTTKKQCSAQIKMKEGEIYAIETYATTGSGHASNQDDCSHYMMVPNAIEQSQNFRDPKAKELLNFINEHFTTLAWCPRWLYEWGAQKDYQMQLRTLLACGFIRDYPPMADVEGSYVTQHEHTVAIKPTAKEIFSFGDDG